ncbi:SCAN domain-containing protein 3 [Caerostris extrusa]|uniref:SCAN domain-containing protein 3 n=1 Tax=Caerostris extrusa TaxID=172846 RepID=A0AAV4W751_CAEEX|nr:SCAN domain-containing protein 3 [Caerostris extrusa]
MFLNSNKREFADNKVTPLFEGLTVKKRYRKYDDGYSGLINVDRNCDQRPRCALCMKVLAPECTLPSKLNCYLVTNHHYLVDKPHNFCAEKLKELKQQNKVFQDSMNPKTMLFYHSYKTPCHRRRI